LKECRRSSKKQLCRFGEEMREMRSQARELADKEQKIASELQTMTKPKQRTLSYSGHKKELTEALNQQKSGLTNLLHQCNK